MGRPRLIEPAALLAVAREVFLERGLQATTAEVAERAGLSEAAVFKRFGSKVTLFHAVLESMFDEPRWLSGAEDPPGKGPVEERLIPLAERGLAYFGVLVPLMMMGWSAAAHGYLPPRFATGTPPQVTELRLLTRLFAGEMKAGRLARRDPGIAARLFLGALQNFVILNLMDRARAQVGLPVRKYARAAVRQLLSGLEPARPKRGRR